MSTSTPLPPAPATTELAARVVDATKIYGSGEAAVRALDGVSVDFPASQFTAVMGPSGSGKSTLMHCMAGLDTLTSGSTQLEGVDLSLLSERKRTLLRRDRIGFVFQAFNLVPTLTLRENIELPLALAGSKPDREWFDQVVATLGLADRLTHRPAELSGGQQQRGAVARALLARPAIVFADEPTGNLDQSSGAEVLGILGDAVAKYQQTIVMVTHDAAAAAHADRVLFLVDGRIVRETSRPTLDGILDTLKALGDQTPQRG